MLWVQSRGCPAWAHQGRLQGGGGTWMDPVLTPGSMSGRSRTFALPPHGGILNLLSGPCRLELGLHSEGCGPETGRGPSHGNHGGGAGPGLAQASTSVPAQVSGSQLASQNPDARTFVTLSPDLGTSPTQCQARLGVRSLPGAPPSLPLCRDAVARHLPFTAVQEML